jgi:hypothetical protein
MNTLKRVALTLLTATAIPTVFCTGCTVRAGYYDPYYHDRHRWVVEEPYYGTWERESHRRHQEYRRRNKEEQREYWEWRHHH